MAGIVVQASSLPYKQAGSLHHKTWPHPAHPKSREERAHPRSGRGEGSAFVFFCFALPAPTAGVSQPASPAAGAAAEWSEEAGDTKWYLYELATDKIVDEPTAIIDLIRSTPQTPRRTQLPQPTLAEVRAKIEKHIKNTYLKAAQAPVGVRPILKSWMELS